MPKNKGKQTPNPKSKVISPRSMASTSSHLPSSTISRPTSSTAENPPSSSQRITRQNAKDLRQNAKDIPQDQNPIPDDNSQDPQSLQNSSNATSSSAESSTNSGTTSNSQHDQGEQVNDDTQDITDMETYHELDRTELHNELTELNKSVNSRQAITQSTPKSKTPHQLSTNMENVPGCSRMALQGSTPPTTLADTNRFAPLDKYPNITLREVQRNRHTPTPILRRPVANPTAYKATTSKKQKVPPIISYGIAAKELTIALRSLLGHNNFKFNN